MRGETVKVRLHSLWNSAQK